MIINRLTKTDCATKCRGTLCSTPLFSMFHGMFHDPIYLNEELYVIIYVRACARKKADYTLLIFKVGHY